MIYMRGQARDYDAWAEVTGDAGWRWSERAAALQAARGPPRRRRRAARRARHPGRTARRRPAGGYGRRLRESGAAANGASRSSACAGTSSTRSPAPRCRPASPPRPTSTAATTRASATSRSTSARAGAGTRPRRSCGRRARPRQPGNVDRRAGVAAADRTQRRRRLRCTGVELLSDGGERTTARVAHGAASAGEVILCAGSIGSPTAAAALGHRPGRAAAAHGIAVLHDLPGVGANLQDHLQIRAVYKVRGEQRCGLTLNTLARHALGQGAHRPRIRAAPHRPDEHGAVAARRLHAQLARRSRIRTSSSTSSRCRSTPSASRCTASTPSPRACATSTRPAAARCASASRPSRRRAGDRAELPEHAPRTARWPPIRCA